MIFGTAGVPLKLKERDTVAGIRFPSTLLITSIFSPRTRTKGMPAEYG